MADEVVKRKANMKAFGLLLGIPVLLVLAWVLFRSQQSHSGQNIAASEAIALTPSAQPQDSTPSTEQTPVPPIQVTNPGPKTRGCYPGGFKTTFNHKTGATRREFASDMAANGIQTMGPGMLGVTTGGDDDEILLFSAPPENAETLRNLAVEVRSRLSDRLNFCAQGFAEIQFIIRDNDMNQRLVTKWEPDFDEAMRVANQGYGTKPM